MPSQPAPVAPAAAAVLPLAEIVVSTSRYAAGTETTPSAFALQGADLASQPSLGDDSLRALARLPGIAQTGLSAQSSVRGGESGEVLVLLDGFPLRQAFHLPAYQSLFSILDPAVIESAEVYTGGFPARYGNRMSGVFDLSTIAAGQAPRRALGLSFFNATALQSGRIPATDIEYLLAGRLGTLKPLVHAFAPAAGSPSYSDLFGRFSLGETERVRLSGNILWAHDELAISSRTRGESAEVESESRYMWLRADHDWSETLSASLWLGHSQIDSFRRGTLDNPGIALGSVADSRASQFWDLRGQGQWQMRPAHYLEAGFEATSEHAKYRYVSTALYPAPIAALFARDAALARSLDVSPAREQVAVFGTHRWRLSGALTSELGVRVQRLTKMGGADWIQDPRLSVRWQLAASSSLRLHWGRFHQADEVQELAIDDGLSSFPVPQRSDQLIVGFDHRFANGLAVRVEGFRKDQSAPRPRFENTLSTLSILAEIAPDRTRIAPALAEVHGFEISLSQEDAWWTRWAAFTWSDALDEVGGTEVPRSWDQTWALTAGLEVRGARWRIGAVASGHRGWPTTALFTDTAGNAQLGSRNGERLPYYASLDLRAERWHPAWGGTLAYALEITNTLNRRNICCTELSMSAPESGTPEIIGRERAWLPLVPSLSIRWEH